MTDKTDAKRPISSAKHPDSDLAREMFPRKSQPLSVFFSPRTVAVIGADEITGSIGRTVLWNLVGNPFGGTVFPVNSERTNVLGIKAYPNIAAIPEAVDLAIIVTPANTVPALVAQCADANVKGLIIVSSGFKECGPEGLKLEQEILAHARRKSMRVIGPNCLGVMSPLTGLNATFADGMARSGNVAFISQSGALCAAVLDWSLREMVGFSCFISVGSMVDVGWGDLIDYLGDDPKTRSIMIYMESIGDARSFLSAARKVALTKPIIVIKAGRTEAAIKAAISHTGSLSGRDEVLDAAFRRCGVLRVNNISDLFYMSEVLAKQPRPKGPRLTIVTNAGGPGVLATDALISSGGELAKLSQDSLDALNDSLPAHWSHQNPIDILGDANPARYATVVEIAAKDTNSDGLLVILTPQENADPTRTAEQLKLFARIDGKPILASWMGGTAVATGEAILNRSNIPTFPYPDTAARAFYYMWRYTYNLRSIYETPIATLSMETARDRARAEETILDVRQSGRILLNEFESKRFLTAYSIPTVETRLAVSEAEAVQAAKEIGYPVVVKLASETVTHKAAAGGVYLDLRDESEVQKAYNKIKTTVQTVHGLESFQGVTVQSMISLDGYEIIIGSNLDPQFGPVLLFGSGGRMVEVYRDYALGLPPLNTTLARRMMEQTRIYAALKDARDNIDLAALEQLLVQFSLLVVEQRWIKEIEVNPLLVSSKQLVVLDARVVLHGLDVNPESIPEIAIHPYPAQYSSPWVMRNGTPIIIRPIRPEDEPQMVKFHETLSERSVYFRYFHPMRLNQRIAHERLVRMCYIDYAREMALIALSKDPQTGEQEILAVGRLIKLNETDGEFAVVVSDNWHHQGLGTELLRRLVEFARDEKMDRIFGDILPENKGMLAVCEKLGFHRHYSRENGVVQTVIELNSYTEK